MTKRKGRKIEVENVDLGYEWFGGLGEQHNQTPNVHGYWDTTQNKWIPFKENNNVTTYQTGRKFHPNIYGETMVDGVVKRVPVYGYESDVTAFKEQYGYSQLRNAEGVVEIIVPVPISDWCEGDLELNPKKSKSPLMCVFDSVTSYCESLLGVKLHNEDREFFRNHSLVDSDGVPFAHTLRVVQELVDPYGLRISKATVAPGLSLKGDILQWRRVLGCNPLGMTDRQTSNEEFIKQGGGGGPYNFEYTDAALFPAISCGVIGNNNALTGSTGGHATYIPPRRRAHGVMLSFQLDRAEHVAWKRPPVFEPIPEEVIIVKRAFDLDLWFRKFRDYKVKVKGTVSKMPPAPFDPKVCYNCKRPKIIQKHKYEVPGCCDDCWDKVICDTAMCGKCHGKGIKVKIDPKLVFVGFNDTKQVIDFKCALCFDVMTVDKNFNKGVAKLIENMTDYLIDYMIEHGTTVDEVVQKLSDQQGQAMPDPQPTGEISPPPPPPSPTQAEESMNGTPAVPTGD